MNFHSTCIDMYLGTTYYGSSYLLDDFTILDVDYSAYVSCDDCCFSLITSSSSVNDDVNV